MKLINSDEIRDKLDKLYEASYLKNQYVRAAIKNCILAVNECETIEVEIPKRGEWIYGESYRVKEWVCSECGKPYRGSLLLEPAEYCPHCGAHMNYVLKVEV